MLGEELNSVKLYTKTAISWHIWINNTLTWIRMYKLHIHLPHPFPPFAFSAGDLFPHSAATAHSSLLHAATV